MTGLDVDGRLPLADGAQVPGGVHQAPEGRDCGGVGGGADRWGRGGGVGWKEKGTVISECAYSSGSLGEIKPRAEEAGVIMREEGGRFGSLGRFEFTYGFIGT